MRQTPLRMVANVLRDVDTSEVEGWCTARKVPWTLPAPVADVADAVGPLAGLVLYLSSLAAEESDERTVDHHYVALAGVVLAQGRSWSCTTHPVRPLPRGLRGTPLPSKDGFAAGGCAARAKHIVSADPRLTRYVGWMIWRSSAGNWIVWAHEWAVTRYGLYIDVGCGLPWGQAAAGVPAHVEDGMS